MRVSFSGVDKTFHSLRGTVRAVRGVDLEVAEGEFFVLLGPSGCGKSTVLSLAAGLEKPTSGEIRFGERVVASRDRKVFVSPRERNVAMVFQSYALYPHLTVFENIAFPLRVAGGRNEDIGRAVAGAAETLGIGRLLRASPGELSGGQRQRVAIARAIVRKPDVFLLDEPLSNLDAGLRASMRGELRRLQRDLGVTTLYERPATPFAASFLGTTPINLVAASFIEEGGTPYLLFGKVRLPVPEEAARRVRALNAERLLCGIRPESIRISPAPEGGAMSGTVESAENLGRETLVRVRIGEYAFSVLTGDRRFREGEAVAIVVPLDQALFFAEGEGPHGPGPRSRAPGEEG
jgi:multiple sugar transport system ATP-binding protein